jgi:hypothetical protein
MRGCPADLRRTAPFSGLLPQLNEPVQPAGGDPPIENKKSRPARQQNADAERDFFDPMPVLR